ncbi:phosphotransferase family protein [Methylobacterium sp. R2-1]|uniref:phosphotransferase family protein n=1 Tax=Methylobacterium sp. R2-1 TaxID=2587064 RepID=UPI00160F10CC|nr:aminoglycoside phosphotransferase family protein [Methylobacterium sp. R2-1]MBB2960446.1 aminoglycoside phosphotransferase (APT) family kinase protein [Methylobacterium sp. R2-1]
MVRALCFHGPTHVPCPPGTAPDRIGAGRSSEVFAEGPDRVVKLYRQPFEPEAVANELAASRLAHGFGLPVPEAFGIVGRAGRTGILFVRLDGPPMTLRYAYNPFGLMLALRRVARIQHAVHAYPAPGLPSQHARLRHQIEGARVPEHLRNAALAALDRLPVVNRLCHGDVHPGNVISTRAGLHLIDWQKATAGDPAADVARSELVLRYGRLGPAWFSRLAPVRMARRLVAAWYVASYCAASGLPRETITAWRLPVAVSRLFGRPSGTDAEVLAAIEALVRNSPDFEKASLFASPGQSLGRG